VASQLLSLASLLLQHRRFEEPLEGLPTNLGLLGPALLGFARNTAAVTRLHLLQVIANGFSRLSFKRATQQQQQQQPPTQQQPQQQQQHLLQQPSAAQQQQPPSSSPMPSGVLPGQLLIGAPPLQLPDADCPMDTQVSPPTWPPQLKHPLQTPAFQSASPSSPAGGVFSGVWLQDVHSSGRQGTAAQAGVRHSSTPSPESGSRSAQHSATVSPRIAAAAAPAVAGGGGCAAAAAAACAGGPEAGPGEAKSGLPPLQTAKVLRAAEKQPNSPSDLPAASLRKVALLRSLLARAEQQFHQQQGGSHQQHQQQQQPTRMQQPPAALFGESATAQQQLPASDAHSKAPWVQPWAAGCVGSAALQQHQQQLSALPPRPVTPWELSSDDMDCSSASSVVDSEGSSSQQGLQETAGPPTGRSQQDQAASVLLCDEVLFPSLEQKGSDGWQQAPQHNPQQQQQQQQQQQRFGCRGRDAVQLPFFNQAAVEPVFGPAGCAAAGSCPALHPQHQLGTAHGNDASTSQQQQHSHCQQQQPDGACERQCSLELSRQALEALRARALASTNQLTCLTQEDLHSLQLGLTSRRGSCDSHTPSGLHEATRPPTPPALRRHSSHI